ncbi:hypothetical protein NDU88_009353 [Pleurodeles waltl]|uniref:Uncharacterized protein n=1 Tax=Pleurodeles waltl TaxID=8319 RepID=A0AAV7QRC5_PLEWA|nr:hypothetical protein NDU88_009353 [Pleurodeles waltl]
MATCAVASNLDLKDGAANPFELPESKGQSELNRTPEKTEKEKRTDGDREERSGGSRSAEERGGTTDTAAGKEQGPKRMREPEECPEVSAASTAGRRRTAKHPATLQEKCGTLRCVLKLACGYQGGWEWERGGNNGRVGRKIRGEWEGKTRGSGKERQRGSGEETRRKPKGEKG